MKKGAIAKRKQGDGSGVVNYCINGSSKNFNALQFTPDSLVDALREGLPVHELDILQESLALPMEQLVPRLGISKATFHRRKANGRLDPAESDRVVRYARLMGKALEVFETEENARKWLTSSQAGLGNAIPLDYAGSEVGAREVEDLLGRIEFSVYS